MAITQVELSNTFNEFRSTFNLAADEINKLEDGTANLTIDTITANTFVGISSDLSIAGNTGSDVVSLATETFNIFGTNGISTSVSSNSVFLNLDDSGVSAGPYGSASQVPVLTVDAQGRITNVANVNVAAPGVSSYDYYAANSNFVIVTADGSFDATIGQDLGTTANVVFNSITANGANLTTLNASNLTSGTIADALFPATLPTANGVNLTFLNATNLETGTVPDARFPATLPTANGVNLTFLDASNLGTGIVPDARFPATLPTANGVNLTFLNASNIDTGTLPDARFPATLPTANGVNLTFLNATNLGTGTVPDARFPTTLPTANGVNLTFLNATNLGTGTVPDARFPTTLPTANGVNLTFLNASNIGTGTLAVARGGTGTGTSATNGQLLIGNGSGFSLATITGTTNRVTVTNGSGTITLSGPQDLATGSDVQFDSFGVGTAASGTTGEIRATNNVTAFYSDRRLKTSITPISDALNKICGITGVTFQSNDTAAKFGYTNQKVQVGVIAQEVEKVLPQVVVPAPFDIGQNEDGSEYSLSGENYMTVQYEKLIPLLIEAIKELKAEVDQLKNIKG